MDHIWKALAEPTRRHILDLLREQPRTTGELCRLFPVSRYAVMKHLKTLEEANLIIVQRKGRIRWNILNTAPLQHIYERWIRAYEACWAVALLKLQRVVEDQEREHIMSDPRSPVYPGIRAFSFVQQVDINALPPKVFQALTADIGAWWGEPYMISESAMDIILETRLGGYLMELWDEGSGAIWATVTGLRQNAFLELTGRMGREGAANGVARFTLTPWQGRTRLCLEYQALGVMDEDAETSCRQGWKELLVQRLKTYVETGERLGVRSFTGEGGDVC